MVGVPKGPGLVRVEMSVPSYARAREIGVGEESSLPVKGWAVAVKTRSEDDGDVDVMPASFQGTVWNGLKAERSHTLPDIKRPPDSIMSLPGAHLWRDIFNAVERRRKRQTD